jgi:hypothetical protein
MFEINALDISLVEGKITVDLTVHDANIRGSAEVAFVENDTIDKKSNVPTDVTLPFEIEDLRVDITLDRGIPSASGQRRRNEQQKFVVANLNVTISKVVTNPQNGTYVSQIEGALRDFLPMQLQSVISERLQTLITSEIEKILDQTRSSSTTEIQETTDEQQPTNSQNRKMASS